jgi:aspartate kinase
MGRAKNGSLVSAITAKRKVAAVEIEFARPVDSELLSTVYAVFDRYCGPVDIMATSPGRMLLLVGSTDALPGIAADLRDRADVRWGNHKALVCLVGENIRRHPDVASRVFAAVSDMDVRILCQGASDRTISFLVEESKAEESVQRLHGIFFPLAEGASDWKGICSAYCQAG